MREAHIAIKPPTKCMKVRGSNQIILSYDFKVGIEMAMAFDKKKKIKSSMTSRSLMNMTT